jgi:hypothetical protein
MKNALVSPNEIPQYVSSWINYNTPVYSTVADAARIAEVATSEFPIAPPLFWVECDDEVVADQWYYQTTTSSILAMPEPAPRPEPPVQDQPSSSGAQPL